jgi:hypothetical protein
MVSCLVDAEGMRMRTPGFFSVENRIGRVRKKALSQKLAKGCTWVKKTFTLVRSR